ncbi:putative nucleotide binding protein [Corchorus capsularis]|uniref:Putative nucleotide binding protein n=1 Tax=Corchorus capsularis TaxID=210143 RepID=A0A1R3ITE5_COCAP|nr:putative nucleotide binding protein [Corchorus capsularis]
MLPSKAWNNLSPDLMMNPFMSVCGNMPGFAVYYRYPNSQRVTYGQFIKCRNDAPISASSMLGEVSRLLKSGGIYMLLCRFSLKRCSVLLWHPDVATQLVVESTVLSADPIPQKSDGLEESADPSFDDVVQRAPVVAHVITDQYLKMSCSPYLKDYSGYKIVNWLSERNICINFAVRLQFVSVMVNNDLMSLVNTRPLKFLKETLALSLVNNSLICLNVLSVAVVSLLVLLMKVVLVAMGRVWNVRNELLL